MLTHLITTLKVIHFTDLKYSNLMENGFDKVSYGDAELTLTTATQLIDELETFNPILPLINELKQVPNEVLIALDG